MAKEKYKSKEKVTSNSCHTFIYTQNRK